MKSPWMSLISIFALSALVTGAQAYDPNNRERLAHEVPAEIQGVGIDEKLGVFPTLGTEFLDETGKTVTLGQYFTNKPVLLSVVYYDCPSMCNFHLNGVLESLKQLDWTAGRDYEVVAVSMNHRETPKLAASKKKTYMNAYGRPEGEAGWHFLTGTEENVQKLTSEVGFRFKWLEGSQEYSHASAAIIMTPGGKISRYLHGIEFEPKTMRLALLEASNGKIGTVLDQVLMFCFQFDPSKNKYTIYAMNIMRIGGGLTLLILAIILLPLWFRKQVPGNPA